MFGQPLGKNSSQLRVRLAKPAENLQRERERGGYLQKRSSISIVSPQVTWYQTTVSNHYYPPKLQSPLLTTTTNHWAMAIHAVHRRPQPLLPALLSCTPGHAAPAPLRFPGMARLQPTATRHWPPVGDPGVVVDPQVSGKPSRLGVINHL